MNQNYANETMQLLYERASCRSFEEKDIPDEVLNDILGAGLHGATGGNLQPYSVIKVKDLHMKNRLVKECGMQSIVEKAPVNLLFCIDWRRLGLWSEASNAPFTALKSYKHFWIAFQDTIICAQNMTTAADALGLGSVYIGTVESCFMELKSMFDLPEGVFPVVLLSLGYPTKYPDPAPKLGIDALVHDEKYEDLSTDELLLVHDKKYNSTKYPITPSKLQQIREVAQDVGGEQYANDMVDKINAAGSINMAQRYFGLHYQANLTCLGNEKFIDTLKAYGFTWIEGRDFPEKK